MTGSGCAVRAATRMSSCHRRDPPSTSARCRRRIRGSGAIPCCPSSPAAAISHVRSQPSRHQARGLRCADSHVHSGLRGDARRGGRGDPGAHAHDRGPGHRHRGAVGAVPGLRAGRARGRHRRRSGDRGAGREAASRSCHGSPRVRSFARPLPRCDAAVASFSLHHVRTRAAKAALYRRIHAALRPRGLFITVDCQPASDPAVRRAQRLAWLAHLRRAYTAARSAALLDAWASEDVYVPLDAELALMRRSGFRVEVLWRRGAFAVLRAAR